ncbi:hypothetical protein [Vibrio panuliri]|uniref:hypothetical protein n=1 Tax=Vibrio panuliri TaxID=1381081 RepID=UPI001CE392B5|nr:hypothetical protein [Vibrio panuliri]
MKTEYLTPTTELQAVNAIIESIGESPVNSLSTGVEEAQLAHSLLLRVSREVQSHGWVFNIEPLVVLEPDTEQFIHVPNNALKVIVSNPLIQARGTRLYDLRRMTFKFDGSVVCEITKLLPFEWLPESARNFIVVRAGRMFQSRYVGSATLNGFLEEDEMMARLALEADELAVARHNIFNNAEMQQMLDRSSDTTVYSTSGGYLSRDLLLRGLD